MIRLIMILAGVVAAVASCDRHGGSAPENPSLRSAFGARVTDGQLQIWTGSHCAGVDMVIISFDMYRTVTELTSTTPGGAEVDRLTLGHPPPGLTITKALPRGFVWRAADLLTLEVKGTPGGLGSSSKISEITSGSGEHPADSFWFQDVGWLNPTDVAEKDGKTFLATCTPDPAAA